MTVDDIVAIYETRADRAYGLEGVSQLEHALQCADLARRGGATPALITAALLHDVGHMIHDLGEAPAERGADDWHQNRGARYLAGIFAAEVAEPVRLHVAAKRYLVAVEPEYAKGLSKDSVLSLVLQGGAMDDAEVAMFSAQPWHREAVALRRYDDAAKIVGAPTSLLRDFIDLLEGCAT